MKNSFKAAIESVHNKILGVDMYLTLKKIKKTVLKRVRIMSFILIDCFDIMVNGNLNLKGDREIMIETLKTYDETIANLNAEMERYRRYIKSFDKGEMTSLGEILHDL